jgi:hypothetical protein
MHPQLKQLIETGIPVCEAHFIHAVNNGENTPERNYSIFSNSASKRVEMYYTTKGLVCKHNKKFFVVPLDNVVFAKFTEYTEVPERETEEAKPRRGRPPANA